MNIVLVTATTRHVNTSPKFYLKIRKRKVFESTTEYIKYENLIVCGKI